MIGQLIGNYKIEAKLGEGGMGAVYKGIDTMLDREVAIKALRPELASQTSIVERFRKEAVTLAKLNHPNIATLYQMFRQGDELYMVLEYVGGATLDSIVSERGSIPAEEAVPVFCQVLDGIDHAHELGIVHRDIKPANMMFTEKGILKVLDFGIARLLGSARMTRAGNIIGTLEYMAPEQVKGMETDGRSDLYALGMMLYEVLTGQLPFQSENEFELMKMQTEVIPRPPREINPNVPVEIEAAIMKAIQKNPDDRFQTGADFRAALIAAGFSPKGLFTTTPGDRVAYRTSPSSPPISRDPAPTETGDHIKGTRLAPAFATPAAAGISTQSAGMHKETRVAPIASSAAAAPASSGSFFSKLTAIHYVVAGGIVLLIFGVILAIPIVFYATRSSAGNGNVANSGSNANANQKLDTVTIATPQPRLESTPAPMPPPVAIDTAIPLQSQPIAPPADTKTKAAPPKQPQRTPKPAAKGKKCTAEQLLTGDC